MKTVFFISDAHLGLGNPSEEIRKEETLIRFLDHAAGSADTLFILGDLFDFWFEYKSVIPRRFFRVLWTLERLRERGVQIHYLSGNHDFWLESFFPLELGVEVHAEPVELNLDGKRFWISHGDGIMKKDGGYRLFKRIVRHPLSVRLYRLLHPDLAFGLAGFVSKLSRNHPAFPDNDGDYVDYAEARFAEGFDCVVLAHTHRPMVHKRDGRTYVNTGDWIRHFSYAKFSGGLLTLEQWPKKNVEKDVQS
jgi:UDP-2,3-diacylglucosamine hydrolase